MRVDLSRLLARQRAGHNGLEGTGWLKGRVPQPRYARLSGEANHPSGARPSKIIITFTWSGPRGVAGHTEAHACAWHVCQLSLSDP
jgi:hypothetical protein